MNSLLLEFGLPELVALLGLAQCVYVLVYIAFRSTRISRVMIPVMFFAVLGGAFLMSAAQGHWEVGLSYYSDLIWLFWTLCVPFNSLLVLQIARVTKTPPLSLWSIFILFPIAYGASLILHQFFGEFATWLHISAIVVGGVSLLVIWGHKDWLNNVYARKNGKERFWLIISLITLNVALLATSFFFVNQFLTKESADFIRIIIGISFVYIASTSLFRIYPQAVSLTPKDKKKEEYLSDVEIEQALQIENLLHLEKIYQEPSYGRSDMARELKIGESTLSKIVNIYFGKSVPQLLNDLRVEEAKVLLEQTGADIATISEEAGFNSIASFNRIFKDFSGLTPSEYRNKKQG